MNNQNENVQKNIYNSVVHRLLKPISNSSIFICRQLEINDFSICFPIDCGEDFKSGFYVKIPKPKLLFSDAKYILPISDEDRLFAEYEYRSLIFLMENWNEQNVFIKFVEPVGFLKEHNAIVTKRIFGKDIFMFYRNADMARRCFLPSDKYGIDSFMYGFGSELSKLHSLHAKEKEYNLKPVLEKLLHYCELLQGHYGAVEIGKKLEEKVVSAAWQFRVPTTEAWTFKGLDIRNVLKEGRDHYFILDPGKMKRDSHLADIARFLVTCRILYWGSPLFFIGLSPLRDFEKRFLSGYKIELDSASNVVLRILILKEYLKHWYMAHVSLGLKNWPNPVKPLLGKFYIDRFYSRHIQREIAALDFDNCMMR